MIDEQATNTPHVEQRTWWIDQSQGTITRIADPHIGTIETASIDELLELLFWLRSREDDLRGFLYERYPYPLYRRMMQEGDYWLGRTGDGFPVKVSDTDWQRVYGETEARARLEWHAREEADRRRRIRPWEFDSEGRALTIDDDQTMPEQFLQERIRPLFEPTFWGPRPENLDAGKKPKFP